MPENKVTYIDPNDEKGLFADLEPRGNMLAKKHRFAQDDIDAINAAIACSRPLLITGEPGIGKSQLARAAASRLGRAFVSYSIDSRSESRSLLWDLDMVGRLADAQLGTALSNDPGQLRRELALDNYIKPGPLWWGLNWESAKKQAECAAKRLLVDDSEKGNSENINSESTLQVGPKQWEKGSYKKGCVVLIDEIDKADSSVPNGLLETLGDGCFLPEGYKNPVLGEAVQPLIVITSNDERTLPEAFLRRCLVYHISLPKDETDLINELLSKGEVHFDGIDQKLLLDAAKMVVKDRFYAQENHHRPLPGLASYIDLLRGYVNLNNTGENRDDLLEKIRPYAVAKGFPPVL